MKVSIRWLALLLSAGVAATLAGVLLAGNTTSKSQVGNLVLQHELNRELGKLQVTAAGSHFAHVSSGAMYSVLEATGALGTANANAPIATSGVSAAATQGCQNTFSSGGSTNIRVNQDCSLRRQAEEVVAVNPTDTNNLVAGQNDSRIGFNHCGYDWSFDGGQTWGDLIPPFYGFIQDDGHTADACSDPTATFDANGNAYVAGVLFDIFSAASSFVVSKSNAAIGGAFYHSPTGSTRSTGVGVVAHDDDPNIFHDKEFIVADANPASPKANNVYATWTRFDFSGAGCPGVLTPPCHSPIYFSQSTDGGVTWSPGIEISGANKAFCTIFSGEANPKACDQDQGSHPIVGRNGTVYVAFGNGNTPLLGVNQHLIVTCPRTKNCAVAANWTKPRKISDDIGKQPYGFDGTTGCPGGRQCLPPNGYRLDDFVEGSISIDNSGNLYGVWADFRNGAANCNPNGSAATATPPCNNDVFYAYSTDGGTTWSSTRLVTPTSQFGSTAQWMPWSAVTSDGSTLDIAFYDRSYGSCETTGCNDITLARVASPASSTPSITYRRLTTASMPNLVPANNPFQAGFLGDYMWLTTDASNRAYVAWADTRGRGGAVEEDVYLAKVAP